MAFKFVILACALALQANASYIHGPMNPHYGPSTAQYASQELHYPANAGSSTQGSSSQAENIIRGHANGGHQSQLSSTQQKTVQINSGSYSLSNQGKSDVRVTNPGTYATNNYNGSPADGAHEQQQQQQQHQQQQQQVTYAPTPSYSNNNHNSNGYEHSVSSSAYQQSTPVYGPSSNGGTAVYGHHSVPVYQYVTSAYGLPSGSSYTHNANGYSQPTGSGSSGASGILGVSYSPAVAVSHMSYTSPVGISYGW